MVRIHIIWYMALQYGGRTDFMYAHKEQGLFGKVDLICFNFRYNRASHCAACAVVSAFVGLFGSAYTDVSIESPSQCHRSMPSTHRPLNLRQLIPITKT